MSETYDSGGIGEGIANRFLYDGKVSPVDKKGFTETLLFGGTKYPNSRLDLVQLQNLCVQFNCCDPALLATLEDPNKNLGPICKVSQQPTMVWLSCVK